MTVYPFILRGVALLGVDVTHAGIALRRQLWSLIAGRWKVPHLEEMIRECRLESLETEIERTLHGTQVGRVVVNLQD